MGCGHGYKFKEDCKKCLDSEEQNGNSSPSVAGLSCEHVLGLYDVGIGSEAVVVSEANQPELAKLSGDSFNFYAFNYCPICGNRISM